MTSSRELIPYARGTSVPFELDIDLQYMAAGTERCAWSQFMVEGEGVYIPDLACILHSAPRQVGGATVAGVSLTASAKAGIAVAFLEIGRPGKGTAESDPAYFERLWDEQVAKVLDVTPADTVPIATTDPADNDAGQAGTQDQSLWFDPSKYQRQIINPEDRVAILAAQKARASWVGRRAATRIGDNTCILEWNFKLSVPMFRAPRPGYIGIMVASAPINQAADFTDDDIFIRGKSMDAYRDVFHPVIAADQALEPRATVATSGAIAERKARLGKQFKPEAGDAGNDDAVIHQHSLPLAGEITSMRAVWLGMGPVATQGNQTDAA